MPASSFSRLVLTCLVAALPCVAHAADATSTASPQYDQLSQQELFSLGQKIMSSVHREEIFRNKGAESDPVLTEFHSCAATNPDTAGMAECFGNADKAYGSILNQLQALAVTNSNTQTQQALQVSEQAWSAFHDAERKAQSAYMISENRGTVVGIAVAYQRISLLRERIAELMFYLGGDQG